MKEKLLNEETTNVALAMKEAELPLRILALFSVVAIPGSVVVAYLFGLGWGTAFFFGSQFLRRSVFKEIGERTGHTCSKCGRSKI